MKDHSKLSHHHFHKGKFVTPFNYHLKPVPFPDAKTWAYGRMPEYLWIGLILDFYGRDIGISKMLTIESEIRLIDPTLWTFRFTDILRLSHEKQERIFQKIIDIAGQEPLKPLLIIVNYSDSAAFASIFTDLITDIESISSKLVSVMRKIEDQHSNEATDVRFIVLYHSILAGKLVLPTELRELLDQYRVCTHDSEVMKMIRPLIRSTESVLLAEEKMDSDYLKQFWKTMGNATDCSLLMVDFELEKNDINEYMDVAKKAVVYLTELYKTTAINDEKMNVLLGLLTFSYKRFKEMNDHQLFNTISGRSGIRLMIELLIMMKYLIKKEPEHDNIWRDYKLYGTGQYKLILTKCREKEISKYCHVQDSYLELLVGEFYDEEYVDMDTRYFGKKSIREKAELVNEKELFDICYDYDSAFEHGLWGAIRESSMLKCDNPAHQYHCIPDYDNEIHMSSVLHDSIMVFNKTLQLFDELYGFPDEILQRAMQFEKQLFV